MSGEHRTIERPRSDPLTLSAKAPPPATAAFPIHPASPSPRTARVPLGELDLRATSASVPRARAFCRALLTAEGAGFAFPHVRDDAEILVSELVTNAVRHAAGACPGAGALRLRLLRVGALLRIEVHDPSPSAPRTRRVDLLEETGRGWLLVAAIADRHGAEQTARGKSVWCELRAWPHAGPA